MTGNSAEKQGLREGGHGIGQEAAEAVITAVRAGAQVPDVLPLFRKLLAAAVEVFNQRRSPHSLVRLAAEVIPTHPKDISAVRARMGTIIESALADTWNTFILAGAFQTWRIAVNYEYPDLYLRDEDGAIRLPIETKALHDEADEGAARFDTPTPYLNQFLDIVVVVGWRWARAPRGRGELVYPSIFAADAFSATEIAQERDRRFRILGGVFRARGRPFVRGKKAGRPFVADPGNYGKLNRIIHSTRRREEMAEDLQRFMDLLLTIYPKGRGSRQPQ